jgi:hypothetical protein
MTTPYPKYMEPSYEGSEHGELRRTQPFIAETDIYPGRPVKLSKTDSKKVVAWTTVGYDAEAYFGIVTRSADMYNNYGASTDYYRAGQEVPVTFENIVRVVSSVAVKTGQKVYLDKVSGAYTNVATNNGDQIGSFNIDGDAQSLVLIHINKL